MSADRALNKTYGTRKLSSAYPHVGLFDVADRSLWIAKNRWRLSASKVSHARLLQGGGSESSTADKDRFVCFWFHTPNSGQGPLQGYPIEWTEGHLIIRLDPSWSYSQQTFIPPSRTRQVDRNLDEQFRWGRMIFDAYLAVRPDFPLSYHMVGTRAAESTFYVDRVEP